MQTSFAQQLYLLQYHILDQIQERMMTRIEPQDSLGEPLFICIIVRPAALPATVSYTGPDTGEDDD
jgi:hypothetical protein